MTLWQSKTKTRLENARKRRAGALEGLAKRYAPGVNYQAEIVSLATEMTMEALIGTFPNRPRVMVYQNGRDVLTGDEMDDCEIITDDLCGEYYIDDDIIVLLPHNMYETQTEYIATYIHELAHSSFSSRRLKKLDKNGRMIRRFDEEAAATMVEFMAVILCGTSADIASNMERHNIFLQDINRVVADKAKDAEMFFRGCSEREITNTVSFAIESFKLFIGKGRWKK